MSENKEQEIIDVPMEDTSTSVVRQSTTIQDVDFFQKYSPEQVLKHFEQKAKVMVGIRDMAIRLTKNDWIDLKGTPYLESCGVERLIATFNINFGITEQRKIITSDDLGEYYIWTVKVYGNAFDSTVEGKGTASQRDKLLSMRNGKRRPSSEIREEHVLQKAVTNGKNKVITSLFGLKGLTWAELKKHGVTPHTSVNYDGKGTTQHKKREYHKEEQEQRQQAQKKATPPSQRDIIRFKQTIIDHFGDETAADNWLYDAGKNLPYAIEINGFDMLGKRDKALLSDLIKEFEKTTGQEYYGDTNGIENRY